MSATKKCSKCSEDISASAKKCKHCHADLRNWFLRHKIISALLIFFLVGSISGAMRDSGRPSSSTDGSVVEKEEVLAMEVTSAELFSAYDKNEIAADEKYKDKWVEVSGFVDNIGKDLMDDMYVSLKTGHVIMRIQCMLNYSEVDKAARLKEGQKITLQGRVDGKLMNVLLRECVIL